MLNLFLSLFIHWSLLTLVDQASQPALGIPCCCPCTYCDYRQGIHLSGFGVDSGYPNSSHFISLATFLFTEPYIWFNILLNVNFWFCPEFIDVWSLKVKTSGSYVLFFQIFQIFLNLSVLSEVTHNQVDIISNLWTS